MPFLGQKVKAPEVEMLYPEVLIVAHSMYDEYQIKINLYV